MDKRILENNKRILAARVNMTLEQKVETTQERLKEFYDSYISFSGGLGSRVLVDISKKGNWKTQKPIAFIDTGLEYPGVRRMGLKYAKYVLRPTMTFPKVLDKYGFPVISKAQAMAIRKLRTQNLSDKYRNKLLYGDEKGSAGKLSNQWHYLLDAPFKISEQCCDVIKKRPAHKFEDEHGCHPITAEMVEESTNRKMIYLANGCNMWNLKRPKSTPMAFWTQQDLLQYAVTEKLDIAEEYGEIKQDMYGRYYTTKEKRTGCMFCMFGCHLEKQPNRFQRMAEMYPKQYDYCINKLGLGDVLDYINVEYRPCGSIKECKSGQLRIV